MNCRKLWGYRFDDVHVTLPDIPPLKEGCYVKRIRGCDYYDPDRKVMSTNCGFEIMYMSPTIPDLKDPESVIAGFYYRVCRNPNDTNKIGLRNFNKFVRKEMCKIWRQMNGCEDVSYEYWREIINFPEWRKVQFDDARRKLEEFNFRPKDYDAIDGFPKEESYGADFKYIRCINSRSDLFKVDVGPFFKQIEKIAFEIPEFIKKIPVIERPQYIFDHVYQPGARYVTTDYTSFEAGFKSQVMKACEFEIYRYIGRDHPEFGKFWKNIQKLLGFNRINYEGFKGYVPATRMSGEMNTSLGNGLFNLMAFKFICSLKGVNCKGVVEGDDGLFSLSGDVDIRYFRDLGALIKFETFDDLGKASFCGQLFDPDSKQSIRDPVKALVKFGWAPRMYNGASKILKEGLLRSKAMSGIFENRSCPILSRFYLYILRMTKNRVTQAKRYRNSLRREWEREQIISEEEWIHSNGYSHFEDLYIAPTLNTRLLFEELYGFTVDQQLYIEKIFDRREVLGPLYLPFISDMQNANSIMYEEYTGFLEPNIGRRGFDLSMRILNYAAQHQRFYHNRMAENKFCKLTTTQIRSTFFSDINFVIP